MHTHLPHAAHDTELLRVDEALQHHTDGHVDVILDHIVPQVDACVGLCHADHGLDVPYCDGDAACRLERIASDLRRGQGSNSGNAKSPNPEGISHHPMAECSTEPAGELTFYSLKCGGGQGMPMPWPATIIPVHFASNRSLIRIPAVLATGMYNVEKISCCFYEN